MYEFHLNSQIKRFPVSLFSVSRDTMSSSRNHLHFYFIIIIIIVVSIRIIAIIISLFIIDKIVKYW